MEGKVLYIVGLIIPTYFLTFCSHHHFKTRIVNSLTSKKKDHVLNKWLWRCVSELSITTVVQHQRIYGCEACEPMWWRKLWLLLYLAIYLKFKHCVSVVAFRLEVGAEGQSARIWYTNGKCGCTLLSHLLNRFVRPVMIKVRYSPLKSRRCGFFDHVDCSSSCFIPTTKKSVSFSHVCTQQQYLCCTYHINSTS